VRPNGFPFPFLQRLVSYLEAPTASSLARCCRKHMLICYLVAASVFGWEKTNLQFMFAFSLGRNFMENLPADPFLQMQCAKICLALTAKKPKDDDLSSTLFEEIGKVMREPIKYPLSFAQYIQKVAFSSPSVQASDRLAAFRVVCSREIVISAPMARCRCLIAVGEFEKYKSLSDAHRQPDDFSGIIYGLLSSTAHRQSQGF